MTQGPCRAHGSYAGAAECDAQHSNADADMTLVGVPIDAETRVAWGSVMTVVYRDTVQGVHYTAHRDGMTGAAWVVRHEGHRADSDGVPVARSAVVYSDTALNTLWDAVRRERAS